MLLMVMMRTGEMEIRFNMCGSTCCVVVIIVFDTCAAFRRTTETRYADTQIMARISNRNIVNILCEM